MLQGCLEGSGGSKDRRGGLGMELPSREPPNLLADPLTPGYGQSKESVTINQSLPE